MNAWTETGSLGATNDSGLEIAQGTVIYPVSVCHYENDIPDFVAPELERLYSNLFSTQTQFAFRKSNSISTYVAHRGHERIAVLLYECKRSSVHVLNEGLHISQGELLRFAQAIFLRYPKAKIIRLHAVNLEISDCALPFQQHPVLEDIVLTLPDSQENYLAGLGKSTRSYLNRYLKKVRRDYPDFQHEVLLGDEIKEELIRDLIAMHKIRMTIKDKISVIDDDRLNEIFQLTKDFGFAVILRLNGKICAGTLNYRVGENYFLETVAHDPDYNDYRIGTLCSYLTVCECIARSGKEYHFLWGDYDYKFRLGGVRRELHDVFLYRSRFHMALNSDFVLRIEAKRRFLQLKKSLQQKAIPQDTLGSRIACNTLRLLQKSKSVLAQCK